MSLALHQHPFSSYCWKALIALHERGVAFERVLVEDRAAHARLWSMRSIPVLVDGEIVLPESTVIIEHLDGVGDAPPLIPADPAAALQVRLWDRLLDGHVMTPMQKIVADALRPAGRADPEGVRQARETLDRAYALIEEQLTGRTWCTGEAFTLADCTAAPALFYARVVHRWDSRPGLTAYLERLLERPSVAPVVEAARPYREHFPLPWPEDLD